MQRVGFLLAVFAAAIVGNSCDTTQPSTAGPSTASIQLDARATMAIVDCYDQWRDTDGDGQEDVFERVVCFPATSDSGQIYENRALPWRYSVRVAKLPVGQTFLEIVAGSVNNGGTFPIFGSLTRFDQIVQSAPILLPAPPLYFLNPRRVSQGHMDYFRSVPLTIATANILGVEAAVAGDAPRFDVELKNGDALIVEAAKQTQGAGLPILPLGAGSNLRISASLYVGGALVSAAAGTVESSDSDGAGISFNYVSE